MNLKRCKNIPNYLLEPPLRFQFVHGLREHLTAQTLLFRAYTSLHWAVLGIRNHRPYVHHQVKRRGKKEVGQKGDFWQCLTLIHVVVGHDGDALLPHHADVSPIAVTSPEEHGQQDGLGNGAPQHTQHHPVVGAVKLQTGKAHHLGRVSKQKG